MTYHPRKDKGVDSMGSDATLQNVGEIEQDCKMVKSIGLTTPFVK